MSELWNATAYQGVSEQEAIELYARKYGLEPKQCEAKTLNVVLVRKKEGIKQMEMELSYERGR